MGVPIELGAMRLGFVGAGNMAGGLARGWAASRGEPGAPEAMLFSDADHQRAEALADEVGGEAVEGNLALADTSDMVILAVKPKDLDEVAPDLVRADTPVISILAGTSLKTLHEAAPGIDLIRVMPNLGAQVREAVLCVAYGHSVDEAERKRVADMLGLVGEVIELEEGLIDAATAIMGCTPGYLALIAEILVEAGVKEGLTEDQARRMAAKAMSSRSTTCGRPSRPRSPRRWRSRGGELPAGHHARRHRRLRQRALSRLLHPDLHPHPAFLGSPDAVPPLAAGERRLCASGGGPVPEHLPARAAADRRRGLRARHQPDPRDHRAQHRLAGGRRADRGLKDRALDLIVPALAACGVVVAVDQGTKALATSLVDRGDRVEVLPFLAFESVRNKGV